MLNEKGQTNAEIVGAAIIMLALLVFVIAVVQQRNAETGIISSASLDSVQCSAISETIADMYSNRGVSEQVLLIERDANIIPRAIYVGNASCLYVGIVRGDSGQDKFNLEKQREYKFRKGATEVVVCEMPC